MITMLQLTIESARRIWERTQALEPLEEWKRFWIDRMEPGVFPENMGNVGEDFLDASAKHLDKTVKEILHRKHE